MGKKKKKRDLKEQIEGTPLEDFEEAVEAHQAIIGRIIESAWLFIVTAGVAIKQAPDASIANDENEDCIPDALTNSAGDVAQAVLFILSP